MKPAFHNVVDFGLRDVGVKNEPRRLAAHFGRRSVPLLALAVLLAVVRVPLPAARRRRVVDGRRLRRRVDRSGLRARVAHRRPLPDHGREGRAPTAPTTRRALAIAPFVLATAAIALGGGLAVIPAAAVLLLVAVLVWRGRRRVPDLVARVRERLADDEAVLGDGLGVRPRRGARSRERCS